MNKRELYKRFLKLGSRIDNLCYGRIEFDLVDNAIHDLWCIIKSEDSIDLNNSHAREFVDKFYRIEKVLEDRLETYRAMINATEFKDCKLIKKLTLKHKYNQFKSVYIAMGDFNIKFFETFGISIVKIKDEIDREEVIAKRDGQDV